MPHSQRTQDKVGLVKQNFPQGKSDESEYLEMLTVHETVHHCVSEDILATVKPKTFGLKSVLFVTRNFVRFVDI